MAELYRPMQSKEELSVIFLAWQMGAEIEYRERRYDFEWRTHDFYRNLNDGDRKDKWLYGLVKGYPRGSSAEDKHCPLEFRIKP